MENSEQKNQQKGIGMPKLPIILLHWKEPLLLMLSSCFGISYRHDFLQGVGLEDETPMIENVDEISSVCVWVNLNLVGKQRINSTKLNHKQSERYKLRDFLQSCLTKKQQKGAGLPKLPIVVFHWKETLLMILSSSFRTSYRHDFSLLILSFLCVCVIWGFVENRRLIAYSQTRHEIHQQSDRCKARWLCDCKKSSFKKATF